MSSHVTHVRDLNPPLATVEIRREGEAAQHSDNFLVVAEAGKSVPGLDLHWQLYPVGGATDADWLDVLQLVVRSVCASAAHDGLKARGLPAKSVYATIIRGCLAGLEDQGLDPGAVLRGD